MAVSVATPVALLPHRFVADPTLPCGRVLYAYNWARR